MTEELDLTPWGYAPGLYTIPCINCGPLPFPVRPMGAKRAWRCEKHALAAREADMNAPAIPPRPLTDDPCVWMIVYEDTERAPETFIGCGATENAHRRFADVKQSWNCHLFVRVAIG